MTLMELKLQVPKESFEVSKALLTFAIKLQKESLKGWVVGQENPMILAALADLAPAINEHLAGMASEFKNDKMAFISGLAAGALDVLDS